MYFLSAGLFHDTVDVGQASPAFWVNRRAVTPPFSLFGKYPLEDRGVPVPPEIVYNVSFRVPKAVTDQFRLFHISFPLIGFSFIQQERRRPRRVRTACR